MEDYDIYRNKKKFLVNLVFLAMVLICFISFILIFLGVKDNLVLNTDAMTDNTLNNSNEKEEPLFQFPKLPEIGDTVNMEFINTLEKGTTPVEIYYLNDIYILGHTVSFENEFKRDNNSLMQFYAVFDLSGSLNKVCYFGNSGEKLLGAKPYRNGFLTLSNSGDNSYLYEIDIVNNTYKSMQINCYVDKLYDLLYVNDDICAIVKSDSQLKFIWINNSFEVIKTLSMPCENESVQVNALSVANNVFLSVSNDNLSNYLIDTNKIEQLDTVANAKLQSIYPIDSEVMVMYSNKNALKVLKYNLTENTKTTMGLSGEYDSGRIFSCNNLIYMVAEKDSDCKMIIFTKEGDYYQTKNVNFDVSGKVIYPFVNCFMLFSTEDGGCNISIVDTEGKIFFRENYVYGNVSDFVTVNSQIIIFCGDEENGIKVFKIIPPVFTD